MSGRWRVIRASVQGTSHAKTGQPCQDSSSVGVGAPDGMLVAAVADGAGSATYRRTAHASPLVRQPKGQSASCASMCSRSMKGCSRKSSESLFAPQEKSWKPKQTGRRNLSGSLQRL